MTNCFVCEYSIGEAEGIYFWGQYFHSECLDHYLKTDNLQMRLFNVEEYNVNH